MRAHGILGRAIRDLVKIIGQIVGFDAGKGRGNSGQNVLEAGGLKHAENDMTSTDLIGRVQQRSPNPRALHRVLKMRRQVTYRTCTPREFVQRGYDLCGDLAGVQLVVGDDHVNVAVLIIQDLVHPMHDLNIRVAPHFTEYGGPLDGFVTKRVKLAEQCDAADFCHSFVPSVICAVWAFGSRYNSSASFFLVVFPTQLV